jgi:NADPH-dependent 2,4-dienoyl-CoA reductase/sulfur reductase-like enzyme
MIKPGKIIVVGGNAAGPAAAAKAKRVSPGTEVTIIEKSNFISTGTCELPYVLSGEISDYKKIVFYTPEKFKQEKGVDVFCNSLVESINSREKTIDVKNLLNGTTSKLKYDKLVLATGSFAGKIPYLPSSAKNVFSLKNVDDLIRLQRFISSANVRTAAVIGSGYLGLELVESLKKINIETVLIEKETLPFPSSDTEISAIIGELLKEKGIQFFGGVESPRINMDNNGSVASIEISGRVMQTGIILTAAGFVPNTELAMQAKIELNKSGAIRVDNKLRTSDLHIYAAGDNIEVMEAITGKHEHIPLATFAHAFGHIAGANAAGDNLRVEPVVKNIAVKIFDNYFVSVGLNNCEVEKSRFYFSAVSGFVPNIVKVMPGSRNVFGKIIYEKSNKRILGASFFGGKEVSGYGDIISTLIETRQPADVLAKINFNYTPPLSPFINLLSVLGRKIK